MWDSESNVGLSCWEEGFWRGKIRVGFGIRMWCGNRMDGCVEICIILGGDYVGVVGDWWKSCGDIGVEGLEVR